MMDHTYPSSRAVVFGKIFKTRKVSEKRYLISLEPQKLRYVRYKIMFRIRAYDWMNFLNVINLDIYVMNGAYNVIDA